MKILKVLILEVSLLFFSILFSHQTFADGIVMKSDGKVLFITDTGILKNFIFSHEHFTNSHVLGTSSGVTITVSLSSFIPTDTPTPTPTSHRPTPTPTSTLARSSAIPIKIPALTLIPTQVAIPPSHPSPNTPKTPPPALIATITTPSTTKTQQVNQVVQEIPHDESIIITTSKDGTEMIIKQKTAQATTKLPVQLNSESKKLNVVIDNSSSTITTPTKTVQTLQSTGSYIIPATMKLNLISVNNQPVYRITGYQHFQIFNTLIINLPLTIDISANNTLHVQVKNPFIVTFLELLHIGKRVLH